MDAEYDSFADLLRWPKWPIQHPPHQAGLRSQYYQITQDGYSYLSLSLPPAALLLGENPTSIEAISRRLLVGPRRGVAARRGMVDQETMGVVAKQN